MKYVLCTSNWLSHVELNFNNHRQECFCNETFQTISVRYDKFDSDENILTYITMKRSFRNVLSSSSDN